MIVMLQLLACFFLSSPLPAPHPTAEPHQASVADSVKEAVIYDVRDLAERDFTGDGRPDVEAVRHTTESLASLLRTFGPLGDGEAVFTLLPQGQAPQLGLGVFAGPRAHAWIREWLALQRGADMLEVEARFIRAPRGRFEELGVDPSAASSLEPEQLERLLRELKEEDLELLSAPRLLFRPATRVQITTHDEIAYIKDWRLVVVEPGGHEIADPVIGTLKEGMELEVLGTLLPDGTIGLDLTASHSALRRPIRTAQLRLRESSEDTVEVALPELDSVSIETRLVLSDGAAILRGLRTLDPEGELGVLIEARVVRPRVEPEAGDGGGRR